MNNRNQKIHGGCSHFYCGHCTKKEEKKDALGKNCKYFLPFHLNVVEYKENKKGIMG